MEKINFQNNITKANAETMTQFQDNIENAINEIKQEDITTDGTEVKCGYKIDGKDVYVKRISLGVLPNKNEKNVPHGITNFIPIKFEGIAYSDNLSDIIQLSSVTPYESNNQNYSIQVSLTKTSVYILCYNDNSDKTGYLNIYFVKN